MPKPPPEIDHREPATAQESAIDACVAEWETFSDVNAWHESKRKPGNYWRNWEGMTVTVFRRKDDYFGWCISEAGKEPRFPKRKFSEFESALSNLGAALEVGIY